MTKAGERKVNTIENANGGAGAIIKEVLLSEEQMGAHCRLFGKVIIKKGSELGYHEHHGESETYYILKGTGVYNDNGSEIPIEPGDVLFCADGCGHGMRNTGQEEIEFIAIILEN